MDCRQQLAISARLGSSDVSRDARPPSSSHQQRPSHTSSRSTSGASLRHHVAHDDSAVYRQSKASQHSAMRHSRPRRGDSFCVGKSRPRTSSATADPPWRQIPPSSASPHPPTTSTTHPASLPSYPESQPPPVSSLNSNHHIGGQTTLLSSDRHRVRGRQPDRDTERGREGQPHREVECSKDWGRDKDTLQDRHWEKGPHKGEAERDKARPGVQPRPHPMVSCRSSPNLIQAEAGAGAASTRQPASERPTSKSSSDIPDDVDHESDRQKPSPLTAQSDLSSGFRIYGGGGRNWVGEESQLPDRSHPHISTRHGPQHRHSSDMNPSRDAQCAAVNSVPNYQPRSVRSHQPSSEKRGVCVPAASGVSNCQADYAPRYQAYENVTLCASASLKSGTVCEDGQEEDAPSVPPRPYGVSDYSATYCPTPPERDLSSLKYIKVNQNHEKYPSWPVSQAGTGRETTVPISARAQSCTDHTNTHTEFPPKQRLAYQPGLRPLMEKNPDMTGGEDAAKAVRTSDPSFKAPVFEYDRFGRVVQKKPQEDMTTRFEDFYQNAIPGYLPPRVDPEGHRLGDKDYSVPSPSEKDKSGVGRYGLLQAGGREGGKHPHQPQRAQSTLRTSPQPQPQGSAAAHHTPTPAPQDRTAHRREAGRTSPSQVVHPHPRPSVLSLPLPPPLTDPKRVDMATSPLNSLSNAGESPSPRDKSPSPNERTRRDSAVATTRQSSLSPSKQASKAFIVKSTPYYNTSTQTDLAAYALKTSDPRGVPQCSVQIQVDEAASQPTTQKAVEEKSIQTRLSREFQPSDMDPVGQPRKSPDVHCSDVAPAGPRKVHSEENYFQYSFEGIKSIQEKYGMDEEAGDSSQERALLTCIEKGDQASIMRQLSEEFYKGTKMAGTGDRPHKGGVQDHVLRPPDSSSMSVSSGSTSQAAAYSSMVMRPSHSAGTTGRDVLGSQSSFATSCRDWSSTSRSSLKSPGGQTSQDCFSRSSTRLLQESKKFKSLSAISHKREASAPAMGRTLAQSHESLSPDALQVDTKCTSLEPGRDSSKVTKPPSPSQPPSCSESRGGGSYKSHSTGRLSSSSGPSGAFTPVSASRHGRVHSVDCVLSEQPAGGPRDRGDGMAGKTRTHSTSDWDAAKKSAMETVGRKHSMKKAYGIYDESDLLSPTKTIKSVVDSAEAGKAVYSDPAHLGQIQEEAVSVFLSSSKSQRPGDLVRLRPQGDTPDPHQILDRWRDDLDKRTGRFQTRTSSELILSPRDRAANLYDSSHGPRRVFDGSIDSGVGSEISCKADGLATSSDTPRSPFLSLDNPTGAELKRFQQQAVLNFIQRKTGKSLHSPESSVYESGSSVTTPRVSQSPVSDPVSDLISQTNANLAKRADSLRRTCSISSRSSSADYTEMSRSRKETEWSRLRSSGSFNYESDRSSVCSDNTYEDISVFAPSTPRGSLQETPRVGEEQSTGTESSTGHTGFQDNTGSNTDSGMMASTTAYQNIPGGPPRRRPPPPPPRSPSPEPGPPPALPPRNYGPRKEEGGANRPDGEGEGKADDSKVDLKSMVQLWEKSSPREDAYTAQLRRQDVKFSGLRGNAASTSPSSMSVLHSRTPTGISTSYKRQLMVAQEATPPVSSTSVSTLLLSSVSSSSSLGPGAPVPAHHLTGSDMSLTAETHTSVSLSSLAKEPPSESVMKGLVDRDTKPVTSVLNWAKPPQLPGRGVLPPPRDHKPGLTRADQPPLRAEGPLSKERNVSDFHPKGVDWPFLSPPEVSRDRKVVDGHAQQGKPDSGSASPLKDSSRSPAGKRRDVPPPPPPSKNDHDGGVVDPSLLPPPPPELLSESGGHRSGEELEHTDLFADDSYGAYRNRGSRQVGTYKRSSSAAVLRPDNQHLKAATDAQALFGDRRLGNQAWNSDSQLQANRKAEVQKGSSTSGAPQRPPERAAHVQTEGGPARTVGKVSGLAQPLTASSPGQSPGRGREEGKMLAAHPFRVDQAGVLSEKEDTNSRDTSTPPSRLTKDHYGSTEKAVSPSSSSLSSASTPLHSGSSADNSGQRWANATAFPSTHRAAGDSLQLQSVHSAPGSPHTHRVPNTRPAVLTPTDSQQPRDRPSGSVPVSSTQNTSAARSRPLSEQARHGEVSPSETKHSLRYAEVAPFASDPRGLPGHVRTYSQSSDPSRSTPSPYSRRESAPVSHIPPEAIAKVSPRLKSEENLVLDTGKESGVPTEQVVISHGRQPSQEELECDQRAKELAKEVADSEKKLSDVLNTDASKMRMDYLNGIFSGPVDPDVKVPAGVRKHNPGDAPSSKPPQNNGLTVDEDQSNKRKPVPVTHSVSSPKVVVEVEMKKEESSTDLVPNSHHNATLIKHKEEVMAKLYKKLDLLKEERKGLQEEIDDNKALGKRICDIVDSKCSNPSERDKFHTYINDIEKIVRLLLNLSGQLARAENALKALDKDEEEADPQQKKRASEKCEGLRTKYAEAKQLKDHIDKRSDNVSVFLRQSLSGEELNDYTYFVTMKSKLTIHLQQLEDEISLGQEQIQELKKSISECALVPETASPSSSPLPVS